MEFKQLGPYELGEPLGKGGMGTVYRATRRDTGERAAVKALAPNLASLEGFRDRFEGEIESLKLLGHPGIVRLLGYGEEDGVLFYAMELVEGTSLEEELRAGRRFTWQEVLDYGIQICRALKHAHDHGVIHRDIKPANLLLDPDGRIKIADFGIARLFGSTQLTSAGGVLGTADYMSPEQTDGRHVTEKCDQYSLGGVMYALLAGRPPFRARSLPEMLQLQRFADPEPVRRYAPEVPQQVERLIMQLLSKDPADRFPNTLVLARHMEAMRRALSRPAADDFALSVDAPRPSAAGNPSYEAVAMETTRIEPASEADDLQEGTPQSGDSDPEEPSEPKSADLSEAYGTALTGPFSGREEPDDGDLEVEPPEHPTRTAGGGQTDSSAAASPARSTARFRTVDDDLLEPRDEPASRLVLGVQVAGLLATIATLIWSVWYFSLPPTADELYREIAEVAALGKVESLRTVEDEIDAFLERFPRDERSEEVAGYREEIELLRLEERLYRRAGRRLGPQSLAPIEQMYIDAMRKADYDPTEAIEDLKSIVILYGVEDRIPPDDIAQEDGPPQHGEAGPSSEETEITEDAPELNRRVQDCLRLVERRLKHLDRYTEMEANYQRPLLRRRLETAHALKSSDPAAARKLYRAILELFEGKSWADEFVQEARQALQDETLEHRDSS